MQRNRRMAFAYLDEEMMRKIIATMMKAELEENIKKMK